MLIKMLSETKWWLCLDLFVYLTVYPLKNYHIACLRLFFLSHHHFFFFHQVLNLILRLLIRHSTCINHLIHKTLFFNLFLLSGLCSFNYNISIDEKMMKGHGKSWLFGFLCIDLFLCLKLLFILHKLLSNLRIWGLWRLLRIGGSGLWLNWHHSHCSLWDLGFLRFGLNRLLLEGGERKNEGVIWGDGILEVELAV